MATPQTPATVGKTLTKKRLNTAFDSRLSQNVASMLPPEIVEALKKTAS